MGEPVNMDHVISEIVKSNYTTKSHDMTPPTETESTEEEPKDTLKPDDFRQLEAKVGTSDHLLEPMNRESTCRTTDHKEDINLSGDVVVEKNQTLNVVKSTNISRTSPKAQKVVQAFAVDEQVHKMELLEEDSEPRGQKCLSSNIETVEQTQENLIDKMDSREHLSTVEVGKEREASSYDPDCTECKTVHPDPTPSELMMYLHALSYKVLH